ncbi:MAG: energy transducer TonB [Ignavibacteriales bacterium]
MSNHQISYNVDLNEIVFTGKNKEYGAYLLRKLYAKHLTIAVWIAIIVFVLGTTAPVIISYVKPKDEIKVNRKKVVTITDLAPPPSIDEKKVIEQVEAPPPLKSTIKFLPPVVKPDDQVTDEYIPTVEELHNVDPGAKTQEGQAGGVDYSLIEVQDAPKQDIVKEEVKEEAFTFVEEMPSYPEGEEGLLMFIRENVVYPEIAKRAQVEGKVMVEFVVEKDGNISNVRVVKGIGAGCDEEAVRVCKLLGRFRPGKQNGKPVRVRMTIPFQFKLQ